MPAREPPKGYVMTVVKKTLTQEIADLLQANTAENTEGYNGEEMIEAIKLIADLDPPVILAIPFCIYDFVVDERGVTAMESKFDRAGNRKDLNDDGTVDPEWEAKPDRKSRVDVLAILAWLPLRRQLPETTLAEATFMLNAGNLQEITRTVFKFWGVDYEKAAEALKAVEDDLEEVKKEREVVETADFPE